VRLISATNRYLIADVKNGPLSAKTCSIASRVSDRGAAAARARRGHPELSRHFLARFAAEEGKRVARSARGAGAARPPSLAGNVRQLENAVFRAVVLAEGDSIGINEFPQIAAQISGEAAPRRLSLSRCARRRCSRCRRCSISAPRSRR
jgi:DNA-binding NtrC family response regulator